MTFVDASAIIAIMTQEPDAEALAGTLQQAEAPFTSPVAVFEATTGLCRKRQATIAAARQAVMDFLAAAGIDVVPIGAAEAAVALDAFARYGKGRGHLAQLNMGDCFAYAAAKSRGASMLFIGDDFARTDIAAARGAWS